MMVSKTPEIVGVILSPADFQHAIRMRNPPALFEMRLDALARDLHFVRNAVTRLSAPLIVTARHPREGGANNLSSRERQKLLLEFLAHANYVDIELRSASAFAPLFDMARAKGIGIIGSFHEFIGTPGAQRLDQLAQTAQSLGVDIFKIATRVDTVPQFDRLLGLFERNRQAIKIAAMGIGKLGRAARLELARHGCPLNYAHLGRPQVAGQLSIRELRRVLL
jgi:3-dehydroquinate dehydratase-1